jgi:hypothetical protein
MTLFKISERSEGEGMGADVVVFAIQVFRQTVIDRQMEISLIF